MIMREIKFRGWDVIGNKWVYGDLVHNQKVTQTGLEPRVMVGGYEVDPESVGQFTGLKDKNNREIYELDLLMAMNGERTVVEWSQYHCSFMPINMEDALYLMVIGTVYDKDVEL